MKNLLHFFLLFAVLFSFSRASAGKVTWTGATNTDWGTANNWSSKKVPALTDDIIVPVKPNMPLLKTGFYFIHSITVQSGATFTQTGAILSVLGSIIQISGTFNQTGGSIFTSRDCNLTTGAVFNQSGTGVAIVTGKLTIAKGAIINQLGGTLSAYDYTKSAGTFNQNGASALFILYHNWMPGPGSNFFSTSGTVRFSGSADINADFISGTRQYNHVIVDAGVNPRFDNATDNTNYSGADNGVYNSLIPISGNFTNNNTSLNNSVVATFMFNGALNQAIYSAVTGNANSTFGHLVIVKPAGQLLLTSNANVAGNITLISGTYDLSTYTCNKVSGLGTFMVFGGATLRLAANTGGQAGSNFPSGETATLASTSTVEYYGSGQTIYSTPAYGNLVVSAAGTKTAGGALTIVGSFTLSTATFVAGSYVHAVGVNWTMTSGIFTNTGNTFTFNGKGTQNISSITTGVFNKITINKTSGTTNISTDITASTLNFIKGIINTGSNKMIIPSGGSVTGAGSATGWVNGNLQKYLATVTGGPFEIGSSVFYTPISITTFNAFSAGSLIASVKSSAHPNISSSSMPSKNISRYWNLLLPSTGAVSFNKSTISLNWNSTDNYSPMTTALLKIARYSGGAWSYPGITGIPTSTSIVSTNASNLLGDFAVGESLPCTVSSGFNYGAPEFCSNGGTATVILNSGATAGAFTSTPGGLSLTATTGAVNLAASTPDTYTITNTAVAACTSTSTTTIKITAAPSATISYPNPTCQNGGTAAVTLTGTTGGTFSSTYGLAINDSSGQIDLKNSLPGTYTVSYSLTANIPCVGYTTNTVITITNPNSASIAYQQDVYCLGGGIASPVFAGTTGGTFSSTTGLSLNASTGDITLASCTPGTYTISYSGLAANGCAAFYATANITILASSPSTILYPDAPYCSSGNVAKVSLTGPTGGIFSSTPGLQLDAITGDIDLPTSTPGSYVVTYSFGGCFTTTNITIIGASINYPGNPYCISISTPENATLTGTTGGSYSAPAGLVINPTNGAITPSSSIANTYTVTYAVPASAGCPSYNTTTSVTINPIGVWSGLVSTDWNVATNWQCNVIPNSTVDVLIPAGLLNYPVIGTIGSTRNLTMESGTSVTITNGALQIAGIITSGGGMVDAVTGKVELNGATAQVLPANIFSSNTLKDLVITNPAGASLSGPLRVTGSVAFGSVNNSVFTTGDSLTLASVATGDASIRDITNGGINSGNVVSGDVIVERYMPAKRAYRFLTAPVNSTGSIKANWMENAVNPDRYTRVNPNPGFGINITGAGDVANGFDATQTHNPSVFTFNNSSQTWVPLPNTNGLMSVGNAYRVIVRGDRNIDMNTNTPVPTITTLRAKGTIMTGSITMTKPAGGGTPGMTTLSSTPGTYSLIANPYPAAVNWLTATKTDIAGTIYIFDPNVAGSYQRGGYVVYNSVMGTTSDNTSLVDNYLQCGQSFFVQAIGPNPTVTFKETDKVTFHRSVFRTENTDPNIAIQLLLPSQQGSPAAADGTKVYFSDNYDNNIGNEDSYKFTNQDENLAILSGATPLCIEGRKPITGTDSIRLKLWQLSQKSYLLKVKFNNFNYNVEAYLKDKYLSTLTQLNTNGETIVPVSITSDAASIVSDRYKIVFEKAATLPLHLLGIKAVEKNNGVEVGWTAESESNMDRYEVEKSSDGHEFVSTGTVAAKANPGPSSFYTWFDLVPARGDNYYRIKSVDKAGTIKYSSVAKVRLMKGMSGITVVPNPISGKIIRLQFTEVKKGSYTVSIFKSTGEKVYTGSILHNTGSANHMVELKSVLASGIYQLQVSDGEDKETISVLFQ